MAQKTEKLSNRFRLYFTLSFVTLILSLVWYEIFFNSSTYYNWEILFIPVLGISLLGLVFSLLSIGINKTKRHWISLIPLILNVLVFIGFTFYLVLIYALGQALSTNPF
jgi:hypothetical protein